VVEPSRADERPLFRGAWQGRPYDSAGLASPERVRLGPQPAPTGASQRQTSGQSAAPTAIAGDPAAGRQVFRKCQACHSLEPGKKLLGPSLQGYDYSPAMKQANIVWDPKTLDPYLADPQKVVPGNKMPFPGLKTKRPHRRDCVSGDERRD
jgi:nitrite reductase (NO-forming)